MIIDSSALVAVVLHEPEAERLVAAMEKAPTRLLSAVNWVEAMTVAEARRGAGEDVRLTLLDFGVSVVAFGEEQAQLAYEAWRRFGKGRHRAALNFGDCCAYAAAAMHLEPLLFKGNDFALTDVPVAPW